VIHPGVIGGMQQRVGLSSCYGGRPFYSFNG